MLAFSLAAVSGSSSLVAAPGLLTAVASLVEHGLQAAHALVLGANGLSSCGFQALEDGISSCGAWASLLPGMWDLPGLGIEPMCPALAGGFFTTKPPGSPKQFLKEKYTSYTNSPVFIFLSLTFFSLFRVVSVYLCAHTHTHTHEHIHAHGHMHTHLQQNSFHLFVYIYTPLGN